MRPDADETSADDAFGAGPEAIGAGTVLLDVRREAAWRDAPTKIAGARWRDPAGVDAWAGDVAPGTGLIVYCVHGHEVSQTVAARLRAAGLKARYLRGGVEGWLAAGRPVEARG